MKLFDYDLFYCYNKQAKKTGAIVKFTVHLIKRILKI